MPEVPFAILLVLARGEVLEVRMLAVLTGWAEGTLGTPMAALRGLGLIDHLLRIGWWITERGKIALAIEIGRRSRSKTTMTQREWQKRYGPARQGTIVSGVKSTYPV